MKTTETKTEKIINVITSGFLTIIGTGTATAIIYTFYIVLT